MRALFFLFVLIFSTTGICQEQEMIRPILKEKRWHIGVNFSPDYAYNKYRTKDPNLEGFTSSLNRLHTGKFGYTTGLIIKYSINKKIAIEAGLQYSNKGYKIDWNQLTFGDQIDPRRGFIYTTNEIPRGGHRNHNYLDIPVRVIYQSGQKKLKFISSIGLITNYRLRIDGNRPSANGGDERYNPRNFSASASAGISYQKRKNLSFTIEPIYRHGLYQTEYGSIGTYLHNVGLNIGCYYAIK